MIDDRPFHIDEYHSGDLDEMMEIENASFTLPWTRESYEEVMALDSVVVSIARFGPEIAGYILTQRIGEEMELHTFAVKPSFRKMGVGQKLLEYMISDGKASGVTMIFLQVRPSNDEALKLYKKFGFITVGLRSGYYQDNNEDAFIMRLNVS